MEVDLGRELLIRAPELDARLKALALGAGFHPVDGARWKLLTYDQGVWPETSRAMCIDSAAPNGAG